MLASKKMLENVLEVAKMEHEPNQHLGLFQIGLPRSPTTSPCMAHHMAAASTISACTAAAFLPPTGATLEGASALIALREPTRLR